MDEHAQADLAIIIASYIRERNPKVYSLLCAHCNKYLLPDGVKSVDEALAVRFHNLPKDHFLDFLKTLAPDDDHPSLFRRMTPFAENETTDSACLLPIGSTVAHSHAIYNLMFDPLSRFFVSGSDDFLIKLFILPEFREAFVFRGHENVIATLTVNPDVSILMSASHDSTVRLWSLKTGECVAVLGGFTDSDIHCALFSPDGMTIACACEDGSAFVWRLRDVLAGGGPCAQYSTPEEKPVDIVCFSPGSEFLAFTVEPNRVIVASLATGKQYELQFHSGIVNFLAFSKRLYTSPHGLAPKLVSGSVADGSVAVWSLETGGFMPTRSFKSASVGRKGVKMSLVHWDLDDHLIIVLRKGTVVLVDSISGEPVAQLPEMEETRECKLVAQNNKDRALFLLVTGTGLFSVWNVMDLVLVATWTSPEQSDFVECAWSRDGRLITASDTTGTVVLLGFSVHGERDFLRRVSRPMSATMDFAVRGDVSFALECREHELALAREIRNIEQNEGDRGEVPVVVTAPPPMEHIMTVYERPRNPMRLRRDDDYDALAAEEVVAMMQPLMDDGRDEQQFDDL